MLAGIFNFKFYFNYIFIFDKKKCGVVKVLNVTVSWKKVTKL